AARSDVGDQVAEEADDRLLAKALDLGGTLGRDGRAEPLGAPVAAACPPGRVVDPYVHGHDPRRLVPEDRVDAAPQHPVRPFLEGVAVVRAVEACRRDSAAVVEHLALLGMKGDPAALGLAAEGASESPGARLG